MVIIEWLFNTSKISCKIFDSYWVVHYELKIFQIGATLALAFVLYWNILEERVMVEIKADSGLSIEILLGLLKLELFECDDSHAMIRTNMQLVF